MVQLLENGRLIVVLTILAISSSCFALEEQKSYEGYSLFRVLPLKETHLDSLRELMNEKSDGIEFWTEPGHLNNTVDILVSPEKHDFVAGKLKIYRVLSRKIMYDVGEVIRRTSRPQLPYVTFRGGFANLSLYEFYSSYHAYAEIEARLQHMTASPEVSLELAGYSYEGRKIHLVKISNDPSAQKPVILFDAGHHAREWISHSTILYMMEGVIEGKVDLINPTPSDLDETRQDEDSKETVLNKRLKSLLEKYDLWFIPVVNPDGYEYTHRSDRLWRKTRSRPMLPICMGADPNRNYPFHWRERGASAFTCDETYAGSKPLSEPEAEAVANVMDKNKARISMYITLHSYGQLILTPYGYGPVYPENYDSMKRVASAGAEAIASVRGTRYRYGPSAVILYSAAGGSDDYAYGTAKIPYSFVIELPDKGQYGFLTPAKEIIPVGQETLTGIIAMIEAI